MAAATVFSICNLVALVAWVVLLAALALPRQRPTAFFVTGLMLPAAFALAYLAMLAVALATGPVGGFNSIAEVRTLFAGDFGLTAGWLHYLAFDLFVGTWIARGGLAAGLPRLTLAPLLVTTFLFGPLGLLGNVVLHAVTGRTRPTLPGELR